MKESGGKNYSGNIEQIQKIGYYMTMVVPKSLNLEYNEI